MRRNRKKIKLIVQQGDIFTRDYIVTSKVYAGFIDTFADKNPLHTDKAFAEKHGIPEVVMHGNILNGFLSHFIGEELPQKNVIIHSQSINFYKPVFLNDTVSLQAEIFSVSEAVKTYSFNFIFRKQSGIRVAKGTIQIGLL